MRRSLVLATRLTLVLACSAGLAAPAHAQPGDAPSQVASGATVEFSLEVLRDGTASDASRQAAANMLVAQSDSIAVRDALAEILAGPVSGAGGCRYVLAAINTLPRVPDRLFSTLSARVAASPEWEINPFLAAISRFRTRDAARVLMIYSQSRDAEVASGAMSALAALSGREDIPPTPTSWANWFDRVENLPEARWQEELVASLSIQASRLSAERTDAVSRLSGTLRQLYLASAPGDRPRLLASWMGDPLAEIRDLGLELTRRELSVTGKLDRSVGEAALKLIESADPLVRARAAVLVRQLAPDGAESAVVRALAREKDPAAAADLLLAAARWPSRAGVAPALAWLGHEGPARDAAAEACCAFAKAAVMTAEERDTTLAWARSLAQTRVSAPLVCLLSTLGDSGDLAAIEPLLEDNSPSLRHAAAEALLWDSDYVPAIVTAARRYNDLFDAASRAVLVHAPTAESFLLLARLEAPSADVRRASLLRLSHGMAAPDLLGAALALDDAPLSRDLLAVITSPERVMAESVAPESLRAIARAAMIRADEDIRTGHPDAALTVIESIPGIEAGADPASLARLRVVALLCLGRLELAELQSAAGADAWLEGLAGSAGKPHEDQLVRLIESRYHDTLTPEQSAALAAARTRLSRQATGADEPK